MVGLPRPGPAVRGDAATVAAHLDALRERRPDLVDTYRALTRATADLAHRAGRVDDETLERIDTAMASEAPVQDGVTSWA